MRAKMAKASVCGLVCGLVCALAACGVPEADPGERVARGKADTSSVPGLEGLDLSPYTELVFVGPQGNVSIQSQGGYGSWADHRTEMIDGYNAGRFTVSDDVLYYEKDRLLHPIAVATGETMVVEPNWINTAKEHEVFQVDPSFAAKILYDEFQREPFVWVLDDQDTLDRLPILEEWFSDGCDDPISDGLEFHTGVQTRRQIIAQLNALDHITGDWSFNVLPPGPLFGDYPRANEVVGFEATVIIPQVPIDRNVLRFGPDAGFSERHVEWLRHHGFVTVKQVGFSDFHDRCY
jgi:hypothetical protein